LAERPWFMTQGHFGRETVVWLWFNNHNFINWSGIVPFLTSFKMLSNITVINIIQVQSDLDIY
jgi:hypothetical protein